MKTIRFLTTAGLICIAGACFSQVAKLTGHVKGLGDTELNIHYFEGIESKSATVKVIGDRFSWSVPSLAPQKITVMFPKRAVWLYVGPGNMELTGNIDSLNKVKLTGSKLQDEANAFDKLIEPISAQEMPLYQKYGKVSKAEQLALEQQLQDIKKQKRSVVDRYIEEHSESAYSLSLVTDRASMGSYRDIQGIYEKLGKNNKATPAGKRLADRLIVLKRSDIGQPMLNFTQNDTEGKPVDFASFKGKYVLVDFWASWCGPCRAENPNVLKAYQTYKEKNFTVVGISLDDKSENWKKAIKDDGMPWTQLSDLKGWKNEVSQYYGINGIPSTLLVDPQGNIIAKDLRGEILNKKLQEIFSN